LAVFYDPVLTLTWAAAFTKKIGLGTSVLLLPMRHPLPLAKELATLQNLSEGRLILGAGSAASRPSSPRSARRSASAAITRAVWKEDPVSFAAMPSSMRRVTFRRYGEAGVEHVLVEPAERALEGWLRAVECIARAAQL
jgi:alkanesulfonate monooxygenase SsuD/methylene tetrahydromethanopterin reductase-like flavin-dependent oxidoreductase (luciferase family)